MYLFSLVVQPLQRNTLLWRLSHATIIIKLFMFLTLQGLLSLLTIFLIKIIRTSTFKTLRMSMKMSEKNTMKVRKKGSMCLSTRLDKGSLTSIGNWRKLWSLLSLAPKFLKTMISKAFYLTLIGTLSSRAGKSEANIPTGLILRSLTIKLSVRRQRSSSIMPKRWLGRSLIING